MAVPEPVTPPRSLGEAEHLCKLWAVTQYAIGEIEAERDAAVAALHQCADADLVPLVGQRAAIEAALAAWWDAAGAELTQGRRKSIELAGCVLGTRARSGKVVVSGALDAVIEALRGVPRLARRYLRQRFELDKAEIAKGLSGRDAEALAALGLAFEPGKPAFFIHPVRQGGTLGALGPGGDSR